MLSKEHQIFKVRDMFPNCFTEVTREKYGQLIITIDLAGHSSDPDDNHQIQVFLCDQSDELVLIDEDGYLNDTDLDQIQTWANNHKHIYNI